MGKASTLSRPGTNPLYQVHAFLDDLPLALAAADAVVARAGGSVAEILARGLPALLVPYPYAAGDHQAKNAQGVDEAGAAIAVDDSDLDCARLDRGGGRVAASGGEREDEEAGCLPGDA